MFVREDIACFSGELVSAGTPTKPNHPCVPCVFGSVGETVSNPGCKNNGGLQVIEGKSFLSTSEIPTTDHHQCFSCLFPCNSYSSPVLSDSHSPLLLGILQEGPSLEHVSSRPLSQRYYFANSALSVYNGSQLSSSPLLPALWFPCTVVGFPLWHYLALCFAFCCCKGRNSWISLYLCLFTLMSTTIHSFCCSVEIIGRYSPAFS